MSATADQANRQIARAAGTVMAAFILSNLTGLLRQMLISQRFGTSLEIDAFYAASTYPDLLFALVAGGALASAFVPTFTGLLSQTERPAAWRLASNIANLITLVLAGLSLLSALLAEPLTRYLLAPEFTPSQQALTAELLRIQLLAPAIFGLSGLLMGILNAHQKFLLPALAPTMYWLGLIAGVLFFSPILGIHGLAWGAVLGAGLHLLIQLPALRRLPELRYSFSLGLENPAVREVARLIGPRLLGVAVVQLNFVINTRLATGMPTGSLTAIKVAWAIMTMPQVVIAQAIAIAALPTFSAQAAEGRLDELRRSLAATLRGVLLLSIPASLGLIFLRHPVTALLFQYREFDARSTDLVAWALLWYTAGLVGHSLVEILSRAFYALHDTRTPVTVGVLAMSLNVAFSLAFSAWFTAQGWLPHGGLALANSLATGLECLALLWLMARRLGGLQGTHILAGTLHALLAGAAMSAALLGWLTAASRAPLWLVVAVGILLGAVVYALVLSLLRTPELASLFGYLRSRLRR